VSVTATDTIAIAGRDVENFPAGLFSQATGRGPGGDLQVAAPHLQLSDAGAISARSSGAANAGNIVIQAGKLFLSDHSVVTTEAVQGDGGNIRVTAGSLLDLRDSQITVTVSSGVGGGGNITIDLPSVVLERSQITANAFGGPGGNVDIIADVLLKSSDSPESEVTASSVLGVQGTVDIRAAVTSLSGALSPLPQAFVSVAELLPSRCTARLAGGIYSSLVLGGRDGLPLDPGGLLPSPLTLDTEVEADPTGTGGTRLQTPTSRFALLTIDDKLFPRMRMSNANRSLQIPPELGCSKWLGERKADFRKSR
jgi:large exoprotein involved in heme utilization and adhesion